MSGRDTQQPNPYRGGYIPGLVNGVYVGGIGCGISSLPKPQPKIMIGTVTVGRMMARPVRDFLKKMKFEGYNFDFIESSGWIERTFTIKGDESAICHFNAAYKAWAAQREAANLR